MGVIINHKSPAGAKDKEQAYNFAVNAWIKDREIRDKYTDLDHPSHLSDVEDVHQEFVAYTNFVSVENAANSNTWRQAREKFKGDDVNGVATTLAYNGVNQMSFYPQYVEDIHDHLVATFPSLDIDVELSPTGRCIVAIGI